MPCRLCQKHVTYKSGIICANYGHARGFSQPCRGAWCADCFTPHALDCFEVAVPRDFNGASLAEVEDEICYQKARPGDHVVCPFQCPNCQSQNIRGCNLVRGRAEDEAFEALSIRATLDAFWSHSSKTVSGHVTEVKFVLRYAEALGIPHPFPRLGPWELGRHLGMLQAIMLLFRSREPGRTSGSTVKFGTAQRVRGTYTVIWDASVVGGGDVALSSSSVKGRYVASLNPSEGRWYQRFSAGICARMGDIVHQDRAYTIGVLLKLLEMYEAEWESHRFVMNSLSIHACMFLLVTCLGGMRGYEAVWTDLAALTYDVTYCEDMEDLSAVSWPIVGRFKAHGGVAGCYMIPIAGTTNSGIRFFEWTQRFLGYLSREGKTEGWAFQRPDGTRALAADYRANLFGKLEVIQATTTLIDPDCNIWEDYGAQRSGRRGFVLIATNGGVPAHLIELQARWAADRANGERAVQRTMIHTYSEVRNMKESLIKPSQVF